MTTSSMLEQALSYARIGWHIFPCWGVEQDAGGRWSCACGNDACKSPGKHPIGALVPAGQNNATTDEDTIRAWWGRHPQANIAVALAASGLCAVDVDPRNGGLETVEWLEAKYGSLQSDVMQFTGGGGWHAIFQLPPGAHGLPGRLGPGVDFKINGYIVADPSLHISGKRYGWEASSDPRDGVVPSPLPDWVRSLSGEAARNDGAAAGSRHLGPTVVDDLRSALAAIPSDDRDLWVRFCLALKPCGQQGWDLWDEWSRKSAKYDPVDAARVWHTAKPRGDIGYETIFAVAQEHGWVNPASRKTASPVPASPVLDDEPQEAAAPDLDAASPCPVDVVNRLAAWIESRSDQSHPLVAQAVALSIISAAAARRYISEHGDPASLYIGLIAPAASFGRSAFNAAEDAMMHAGLAEMVRGVRISSPQQLFSSLYQAPALYYLADDWGEQMYFARRQPSGLLGHAMSIINGRIWSAPSQIALDNWAEVGLPKARAEVEGQRPILQRPTLNLLALIAGSQVEQALRRSELARGAVDSMIFICAEDPARWTDRPGQAEQPLDAAVHETLRRLRGFDAGQTALSAEQIFGGMATIIPATQTVRITGDLQGAQMALAAAYAQRGPLARMLSAGARRNMARICTALAAAANPDDPVITDAMVQWAAAFMRQALEATLRVFRDRGGAEDGETGRPSVYAKVEGFLRDCGSQGASKREIVKGVRMFRELADDKRDELLERIVADGMAVIVTRKGVRGHRYVLADFTSQQSPTSPTIADSVSAIAQHAKSLIVAEYSEQSPTPTFADATLYKEMNTLYRSASAMSAIANFVDKSSG
ncbi:bifunctional DNA primase/polymerase [Tepidimonas sp. HKU79]|uniref:bifunctional DNA primase/polymerase n=1 Tax=Tepidimonas sp. HKU79 TaxID=3414505 RepID=UPI003C7B9725